MKKFALVAESKNPVFALVQYLDGGAHNDRFTISNIRLFKMNLNNKNAKLLTIYGGRTIELKYGIFARN
ncbi:hypothetical protein [Flagellimonas flava]|uniref:hypothetical protein n=1 Tax=Flagellimonas flava TaxID=570519 RepID=UPI003D64C481